MIDSTHIQVLARSVFRRKKFLRVFECWVLRNATKPEVADLIERFLKNRLSYPQEWNDFVECRQRDPDVEVYRKKCYNPDPLVNCPDPVDQDAIAELRLMAEELRAPTRNDSSSQ